MASSNSKSKKDCSCSPSYYKSGSGSSTKLPEKLVASTTPTSARIQRVTSSTSIIDEDNVYGEQSYYSEYKYPSTKYSNFTPKSESTRVSPKCPAVSSNYSVDNSPSYTDYRYYAKSNYQKTNPNYGYVSGNTSSKCPASMYSTSGYNNQYNNQYSTNINTPASPVTPRKIRRVVQKIITESPSSTQQNTTCPAAKYNQSSYTPPSASTKSCRTTYNPTTSKKITTITTSALTENEAATAVVKDKEPNSNEVEKQLEQLEITEREQLNKDLVLFQQARRRLVRAAAHITSSSKSCKLTFPSN